jgi:hypothetical protein
VALHWLFFVLPRGRVDGVEACNFVRAIIASGARPKQLGGAFGFGLNF